LELLGNEGFFLSGGLSVAYHFQTDHLSYCNTTKTKKGIHSRIWNLNNYKNEINTFKFISGSFYHHFPFNHLCFGIGSINALPPASGKTITPSKN
jgi:hypothetical protein